MRIPTSLVVMSCVTALPFGLAIRDTVRHSPRGDELDLTGERARARELREKEQLEEARAQAEYEARRREHERRLDALYGPTPASEGHAFDNAGGPTSIEVGMADCDRMHEKLRAAWGPPTDDVWVDPTTHHRASLTGDDCILTFEPYLDVDAWVARLPFDLLGKPTATSLEPMPGVGYGHDGTLLDVEPDDHNKIIAINAIAFTDRESQAAIVEALSVRLRARPMQSATDPNVWTWPSTPVVRFDASGASRFSVQIGKPSWQ